MTKSNHRANHRHTTTDYDLRGDYENIKTALAEATEDIKGRASEIFYQSLANVKDKSSDVKVTVEDYIVEKPFKSIGIAAAAGFILGFLLRK